MKDKDLIKQLNSLKSISLDVDVKSKKRELLLSQLSNSAEPNVFSFSEFILNFKAYSSMGYNYVVKPFAQPVLAVVLIMVLVLGGGIASMNAAKDSKPGDSFYVAKIIQEKTQIALTFDEKKKAQLNLEFAGNRANEITKVMETEDSQKEKTERVAKLTKNFENEIKQVKERLVKIGNKQNEGNELLKNTVQTSDVPEDESQNKEQNEDTEGAQIFSAGLDKDTDGLELSDKNQVEPVELADGNDKISDVIVNKNDALTTTTPEISTTTIELQLDAKEITDSGTTAGIINEAKELLKNEDIDGTLMKIDEAIENLNIKIEDGEVKGVEEEAPIEELIEKANEKATSSETGV